ncbi:MAG: phosphoenolpyruvate synthase [Anaerolineae bacterium]|nr:phosphoenolpyruvate synthase [Anaerolineae bacterium]NIN95096.1 phosphoenolpyruvate synthase [Anaerolineae bacterium]NIQ78948.1 phosphoenolpyruvate synthase [Anaerolineae bacterium]
MPEGIRWFTELSKSDVPTAGGKGANLGEMTQAGLPVPPGFTITTPAYRRFTEATGVLDQLKELLQDLDVDDNEALQQTAEAAKQIVVEAEMPKDVAKLITDAYKKLCKQEGEELYVAVRSSATAEDTAEASFAGMNETFLNVRGDKDVIESVKKCWASLYGARVIFYRVKRGFESWGMEMGVIVQKMVDAEKAGVAFTQNPATGAPNEIIIEAAWGLADPVVAGQVSPDYYMVDKNSLNILQQQVKFKKFMRVRRDGQTVDIDLPDEEANKQVLTEDEIHDVAKISRDIEDHYGWGQDIEWAIEDDKLYIVQSRPITTIGAEAVEEVGAEEAEVLLRGLGAAPGRASGEIRILSSVEDGVRLNEGDVLVTVMTAPDWVPLMRKASAIVTDQGGMTCHAAIVSRELGIPAVVGTDVATTTLEDGMMVTVDGSTGDIYAGKLAVKEEARAEVAVGQALPVTATKVLVNLGEPSMAERVAKMPVDGIGLLRAEFMIIEACEGTHPRRFVEEHGPEMFVERMYKSLLMFSRAFNPRPITYRTMDFRSNEFRDLQGGKDYEPTEANPMIGYRGSFRYVHEPDLFKLELDAVKRVRDDGFKNLHVMLPFVRTLIEVKTLVKYIEEVGLFDDLAFDLWVMAEVPSVIFYMEQYQKLGVAGISIGSNDLTQLVLAIDRDSELVAPLFNEMDEAVLDHIRQLLEKARELGMKSSICGQAPSVFPEYAGKLVEWGINSISVNWDVLEQTIRNVASAEQRLLLEDARNRR